MIDAERRRVLEIRSNGTVASEVVSEVLSMLDVEESMLEHTHQSQDELREVNAVRRPGGRVCDDLERAPGGGDAAGRRSARAASTRAPSWVALRQCLDCGAVGCCDSSPRQHSTAHFRESAHPVIQSAEPREDWRWCFVHHLTA